MPDQYTQLVTMLKADTSSIHASNQILKRSIALESNKQNTIGDLRQSLANLKAEVNQLESQCEHMGEQFNQLKDDVQSILYHHDLNSLMTLLDQVSQLLSVSIHELSPAELDARLRQIDFDEQRQTLQQLFEDSLQPSIEQPQLKGKVIELKRQQHHLSSQLSHMSQYIHNRHAVELDVIQAYKSLSIDDALEYMSQFLKPTLKDAKIEGIWTISNTLDYPQVADQ